MEIDISKINKVYVTILKSMSESILSFYDTAISGLDVFKNEATEAMYESIAKIKGTETEDILKEYNRLAETVVAKIQFPLKMK